MPDGKRAAGCRQGAGRMRALCGQNAACHTQIVCGWRGYEKPPARVKRRRQGCDSESVGDAVSQGEAKQTICMRKARGAPRHSSVPLENGGSEGEICVRRISFCGEIRRTVLAIQLFSSSGVLSARFEGTCFMATPPWSRVRGNSIAGRYALRVFLPMMRANICLRFMYCGLASATAFSKYAVGSCWKR